MGAKPLDPIMEDLIRLETFADEEDNSSEHEIERSVRKSRQRPSLRKFSRGHRRDVERHAIDSSLRRRLSVRGWGCPRLARLMFASAAGFFVAMVLFHILVSSASGFGELRDEFDEVFSGPSHVLSEPFNPQREAFLRNVLPVPCHSHNDYWRRTPLYAALGSGCISVEADVWLFDDDLFVGHDIGSLTRDATLRSMYLSPLERVLRIMNANSQIGNVSTDGKQGVFSLDPDQTLVLLVDLKTSGPETYAKLDEQLQSLRNDKWLTHWNGTHRVERPITIVASGQAPFELIAANDTYRDIFFDAPLNALASDGDPAAPTAAPGVPAIHDSPTNPGPGLLRYKYNPRNSWYASSNFRAAGGIRSVFEITAPQIENLADHIRMAEARGLVPRYWGTPRWPRALRDQIWEVLLQEGVGILNVDDLRAARKGSWGHWDKRSRGS
ncbi:hypothetical protein E4T49_07152 [Aureobasidium sp. EXF-10728]|nr:hypothetical protein E4T49_07152 [Aureobasidium sp. EXF-10728]